MSIDVGENYPIWRELLEAAIGMRNRLLLTDVNAAEADRCDRPNCTSTYCIAWIRLRAAIAAAEEIRR